MAYRHRLIRSLLLIASLTPLGIAAQANERTFSCKFTYQTTIRTSNGQLSSTGSPTVEQILLLEKSRDGALGRGTYVNLISGWSGPLLFITDQQKTIAIEDAASSDNHFVITIIRPQVGSTSPAILARQQYVKGVDYFSPQQFLGECRSN